VSVRETDGKAVAVWVGDEVRREPLAEEEGVPGSVGAVAVGRRVRVPVLVIPSVVVTVGVVVPLAEDVSVNVSVYNTVGVRLPMTDGDGVRLVSDMVLVRVGVALSVVEGFMNVDVGEAVGDGDADDVAVSKEVGDTVALVIDAVKVSDCAEDADSVRERLLDREREADDERGAVGVAAHV
jgi:hypothetical protein